MGQGMNEQVHDEVAVSVRAEPLWVRVIERLSQAAAVIGAIAALLLALNVIIDVTLRYLFRMTLPGTLDLVMFWWMPISAVLPQALTELSGEHIRVSLLTERLRGIHKRIIDSFGAIVALIIVGSLVYYTAITAVNKMEVDESALGAPWIPVWPVRMFVVLGLVIFLLQICASVYRAVTGQTDDRSRLAGAE